jgi:phenylacetate-CoA ligase
MMGMTIRKTPLEAWVAERLRAGGAVTREQIDRYQLQKLRETISLAFRCSPFYRKLLQGFAGIELACLADLRRFPFTTAEDIRQHGLRFLCVSQSDISRVVTLDSSGTTGKAKRLFFTPADQRLTVDFFRYGMAALAEAGDKVLILLPGERSGSVGDLLAKALTFLGARPIPHGIVRSIPQTLEIMAREEVDALVGIPAQVLALARYADAVAGKAFRLKNVLLSTDHVPAAVVSAVREFWDCEVFEHYGMTEMGLGGGTDCAAHAGYHLHEADFYFEIIDPLTGDAVPEGREGEVVVTTLTRQGMPLIRYRTGDMSRFLPEPCGCGAILRRLERIAARIDDKISLHRNSYFTIAALDEALFAVTGVIDYSAAIDNSGEIKRLLITALTVDRFEDEIARELYAALDTVPAIQLARQAGILAVTVSTERCSGTLTPGATKRAVMELNTS